MSTTDPVPAALAEQADAINDLANAINDEVAGVQAVIDAALAADEAADLTALQGHADAIKNATQSLTSMTDELRANDTTPPA